MSCKYYVYRHVRLDKNEPFYIGIGTKDKRAKTYRSIYTRAYVKERNKWWGHIINKTSYKIQIIWETNDYLALRKKEREFIKLYGRKDLNLGPLVNLTDGYCDEEIHDRNPESSYKRANSTEVYIYNLVEQSFVGRFSTLSEASFNSGISLSAIYNAIQSESAVVKQFLFSKNALSEMSKHSLDTRFFEKGIFSLTGELLFKSNDVHKLARFLRIEKTKVSEALKHQSSIAIRKKSILRNDGQIFSTLKEAALNSNCHSHSVQRQLLKEVTHSRSKFSFEYIESITEVIIKSIL